MLEVLIHADPSALHGRYAATPLDIPDEVGRTVLTALELPADWRDYPPPVSLAQRGDAWLDAARTAVLVVPSAVVPVQNNFLLNPEHPDFGRCRVGDSEPYVFDSRLRRS